MPINRFCDAISTWFSCIIRMNDEMGDGERWCQGSSYFQELPHIEIDIRKSNLLWRLLYEGERLRTVKCEVHKGHQTFNLDNRNECGCDGTGWKHAPEESV